MEKKLECYVVDAAESEVNLIGTTFDFYAREFLGGTCRGTVWDKDARFEIVGSRFVNDNLCHDTNWYCDGKLSRRLIQFGGAPKYELSRRIINMMETGVTNGNHGAMSFLKNPRTNQREMRYGLLQGSYKNYTPLIIQRYRIKTGSTVEMCGSRDEEMMKRLGNLGYHLEMIEAQNEIVTENIYDPAERFCKEKGFPSDLSHAVISFALVTFGCVPQFIRSRMQEDHEDEKRWITDFVICMIEWLKGHDKHIFRQRAKQANLFDTLIQDGAWNPDPSAITLNGVNLG